MQTQIPPRSGACPYTVRRDGKTLTILRNGVAVLIGAVIAAQDGDQPQVIQVPPGTPAPTPNPQPPK